MFALWFLIEQNNHQTARHQGNRKKNKEIVSRSITNLLLNIDQDPIKFLKKFFFENSCQTFYFLPNLTLPD